MRINLELFNTIPIRYGLNNAPHENSNQTETKTTVGVLCGGLTGSTKVGNAGRAHYLVIKLSDLAL